MTALRVWVFGCSHLTRDIDSGRESLGQAIEQSETAEFGGWDIAIDLGDHNGGVRDTPVGLDGREYQRQRDKLTTRPREAIYPVQGNHDRERAGEPPGWWFRTFVDPLGENPQLSQIKPENRPYPIEGTWERYKFEAGNIVFLMISDVTRPLTNLRGPMGGDPGGVVTQETFDWWKAQCELYRGTNSIVITCAHYLPKDTTIATGDYEGGEWDGEKYTPFFHGSGRDPRGSGRLHYIGEEAGAAAAFSEHLQQHPGDVNVWLGSHTHTYPGNSVNGRGLRKHLWGCHFIQCAGLTRHHGPSGHQVPRSRLFSFEDGQSEIMMHQWHHTDGDWAGHPIGWRGDPIPLAVCKTIQL